MAMRKALLFVFGVLIAGALGLWWAFAAFAGLLDQWNDGAFLFAAVYVAGYYFIKWGRALKSTTKQRSGFSTPAK